MNFGERRGEVVRAVLIAVVWGFVASVPLATAASLGASVQFKERLEAAGGGLEELVESKGALGYYWDEGRGEFVVVVPAAGSAFQVSDAADLRVPLRVEAREITRATIDEVSAVLLGLRPSIKEFAYAFHFDPASGKIILRSEAPRTAFAALVEKYPGVIEYGPAVIQQAGWSNDTSNFKGGTFIYGSKTCTSGSPP